MNSCSLLPAVLQGQQALAQGQVEKGTSQLPHYQNSSATMLRKKMTGGHSSSQLSRICSHTFLYT